MRLAILAFALAAPAAADQGLTDNNESASAIQVDADFAARLLLAGEKETALIKLEQQQKDSPNDPAVMINLGIVHAQMGDDVKARAAFNDALVSSMPQDLDIADGRTLDSRRIARVAIQMLDRGEFRSAPAAIAAR